MFQTSSLCVVVFKSFTEDDKTLAIKTEKKTQTRHLLYEKNKSKEIRPAANILGFKVEQFLFLFLVQFFQFLNLCRGIRQFFNPDEHNRRANLDRGSSNKHEQGKISRENKGTTTTTNWRNEKINLLQWENNEWAQHLSSSSSICLSFSFTEAPPLFSSSVAVFLRSSTLKKKIVQLQIYRVI